MSNPTSSTPIWRYLDLAKLVGVLARGLFFTIPSALRRMDPWEGSLGELDYLESMDPVHKSPTTGPSEWKKARANRLRELDSFGVSCWHESATESAALWDLYVPRGLGVAIKSSQERILESLHPRDVSIHRVDYSGHHSRKLGSDPITVLTTKRPEFAHERELRVLTQLSTDEVSVVSNFYSAVEAHGRIRKIRPGHTSGPLIVPGPSIVTDDATCFDRGAPAGIHVPTNASVLIEKLSLPPRCSYSLRRAVIDLAKQFNLPHGVVSEASMDLAPFDDTEFV